MQCLRGCAVPQLVWLAGGLASLLPGTSLRAGFSGPGSARQLGVEWRVTRTKSGRKAVSPPPRRLKDQTAEDKNKRKQAKQKCAPTEARTKQPTYLKPTSSSCCCCCCCCCSCTPSAVATAADCVDRGRVSTGGRHDPKWLTTTYRKQASPRRVVTAVGTRQARGMDTPKANKLRHEEVVQQHAGRHVPSPGDGYPDSQQASPRRGRTAARG